MYKNTHKASQGRADRLTIADLQTGGPDMSDDERYAMLRKKVQELHLANETAPEGSPERARLGKQIFIINTEINRLNIGRKKRPNLSQIFMDAAHNLLLPKAYDAIMREVEYIHDCRNKSMPYDALERRRELQLQKALKSDPNEYSGGSEK